MSRLSQCTHLAPSDAISRTLPKHLGSSSSVRVLDPSITRLHGWWAGRGSRCLDLGYPYPCRGGGRPRQGDKVGIGRIHITTRVATGEGGGTDAAQKPSTSHTRCSRVHVECIPVTGIPRFCGSCSCSSSGRSHGCSRTSHCPVYLATIRQQKGWVGQVHRIHVQAYNPRTLCSTCRAGDGAVGGVALATMAFTAFSRIHAHCISATAQQQVNSSRHGRGSG
jgi:hypothetical protein